MAPLALAALAVVLVWVAPGLLARCGALRHSPRAALVAWQAVSLGGVTAALAVAPAALALVLDGGRTRDRPALTAAALLVTAVVLGRLLASSHRVGTRLRAARAEHRALVDVLGERGDDGVVVLEHPTPTAYCIPGRGSRVVLSRGVLDALAPEELAAVVAHERAHLRARHDLLLELFGVLHESVPPPVRSEAALAEVRLLVEALADRGAAARTGAVATARALIAVAEGGVDGGPPAVSPSAAVRLGLLGTDPSPTVTAAAYALAVAAVATPVALLVLAWW